ncbi:hypothetical protein [Ferrimonas marina]|uniref:Uncharacterized protein n=1 Tax=Ferrimonas marina TaxID=299255 RepID=A0A1M5TQC0_9GAMM|nr:hypothetical protein [Ferrimonas marina]SHH52583.1 hypothetical protein SAMN02745129_2226 [Ferrimonas marina]
MKKVTLSGLSLEQLKQNTAAASEVLAGNPVGKDRLIKQFLTRQLDLDNEHQLTTVFEHSPARLQVPQEGPSHFFVSNADVFNTAPTLRAALEGAIELGRYDRVACPNLKESDLPPVKVRLRIYRVAGASRNYALDDDFRPVDVDKDYLGVETISVPAAFFDKGCWLIQGVEDLGDVTSIEVHGGHSTNGVTEIRCRLEVEPYDIWDFMADRQERSGRQGEPVEDLSGLTPKQYLGWVRLWAQTKMPGFRAEKIVVR